MKVLESSKRGLKIHTIKAQKVMRMVEESVMEYGHCEQDEKIIIIDEKRKTALALAYFNPFTRRYKYLTGRNLAPEIRGQLYEIYETALEQEEVK